jgi:hypothetical protein
MATASTLGRLENMMGGAFHNLKMIAREDRQLIAAD